jgi:hypothetical protein
VRLSLRGQEQLRRRKEDVMLPRMRRWKHCFGCGYDRFEQELFEATRSVAKKGRELSPEKIQIALAYHAKVFGRHNCGAPIGD